MSAGTLPGGLGEALPPEELGDVAGQLANLTRDVVAEPVHFVKTIGDAVMLVSPDAEKLLNNVLDLMEAAGAVQFPQLRAGIASGLAVTRAGDWYGSPVNLASRVTGVAPPSGVLVAESVRTAIGDVPGIVWSFSKSRHLRGVRGEVRLFRASRAAME
jgi:adenylate cyclase